jgi:hypothetical protein
MTTPLLGWRASIAPFVPPNQSLERRFASPRVGARTALQVKGLHETKRAAPIAAMATDLWTKRRF